MPQPSDDTPAPPVAHSNPVTRAGFTMIPNAILFRADLRPLSKLVYGYLGHLAWRNDTDAVDPLRAVIAADLDAAEDTVRVCLRELQKAPCLEGDEDEDAPRLLVSKRRGLGMTNVYIINDPVMGEYPTTGSRDSSDPESRNPAVPSRGRVSGSKTKEPRRGANAPLVREDNPPALTMIDSRNVALDALADACGVDAASPRFIQAVVALNGRFTKGANPTLADPGIRHLFWREFLRWADEHDPTRIDTFVADPERFELALERGIRRKAALYRERMPGAALTPKALRDWWFDIERVPERDDGGLTAAEMARFTETPR